MQNYKLLAITTLSLTTTIALAGGSFFNAPYVGVEIIQTNQNFKNTYGKGVFKKNPQDYNIFAGFKFSKYFGSELGYEFQPKRNKDATLTGGDGYIAGYTIPNGDVFTNSSNVKGYHPYLGLFVEAPQASWVGGKVKFQALIAASFSEIKGKSIRLTQNGDPDYIESTYSKSRIVPMVKLSATNNFNEHFGLRLSLNYRNLSQFKIFSQEDTTKGEIRLKDTYGIGLGLVYAF